MNKYGLMKRWIAMLLSVVMVFSLLPAMQSSAAVVVSGAQITDDSTMDSWKSFFDPDNITTAHAGGVWTDKSVFTDSPFQGITVNQNNFLVALSALGSNSVVVGQTYAPTDTMFVLDVSNSMSNNALSNMVTATNNAIRTLLEGEGNTNRVGVVLYGTTASVLLPLDHYDGVSVNGVENFIELNGSSIRAAQLQTLIGITAPQKPDWWDEDRWGTFPPDWWQEDGQAQYETTYIKNSAGNDVTTSVSTGGGTYIQGGLWKAWQEFSKATVETSGAVRRAPAMVLMSDGAPTYSASDFDNVPNRSNYGTGSDSYNGDGFVTQLTSAYIKAKMAQKYDTTAYFYTLGLDVGDIAIAEAVLNPQEEQTTGLASLWTRYLALQNGETLSVSMRNNNSSKNVDIDKVAEITGSNYVDRYFEASQISDLNRQFQNIVNEISLSAGYYPTHLDDNGSNYSGYITFVDELGSGMEVKAVKGIVIGDKIYTGELLARALITGAMGTKDAPTALGDELVRSIMARLGLSDKNEVWDLLSYAYNVRKSLYFDTTTNKWSNHIVWYGDADGNYLGYDESLESIAAYRNVCYGMLGSADGTHQTSDMMYVGIQVSRELATGNQTVTFRVPASMLPVVTYQISIDGNEVTENSNATLTYKSADPIRLVYEVGVRESISELDLIQYAQKIGDKYYMYTNSWNANPNFDHVANNDLTYAYFEPGADNEHYYFTDDSVIYSDENVSSVVTSNADLDINGNYYYRHYIFKTAANPNKTVDAKGNITVSAVADFHFEELSQEAIAAANVKNPATNDYLYQNGNRVVPDGTMHYAHSHDLRKAENDTETYGNVRKQIVDANLDSQAAGGTGAHHYELVYMGNNGRLEVEPTQGIKLNKKMSDNSTPADVFTFEVALELNASSVPVKLVYEDVDGVKADPVEKTVNNGKLQVQLKAGEAVYIYDIPAGTGYTVTELENDTYHQVEASAASGTITDDIISDVTFTNAKTVYSELNVTKYVTYLKGASSANEADKKFAVTVTLTKGGTAYAGKTVNVGGTDMVTDVNGQITFEITDRDTVKITNIPVGVSYAVSETIPAPLNGYYTWTNSAVTAQLQGTVTVAGANAVLHNTYTPADLKVNNIVIDLTKKLVDATGAQIRPWPCSFSFTVSRWDGEDWQPVETVSRDEGTSSGEFTLPEQTFPAAGTYYFRVEETVDAPEPGVTYDRTFHDFAVTVADTELDGALELVSVTSVQNAEVQRSGSNWEVTTEFTNIYVVGSTQITFTGIKNLTGRTLKDGEFTFTLTGVDNAPMPSDAVNGVVTVKNGLRGDLIFPAITYTAAGTYRYVVEEVIPAEATNNVYKGVTYTTAKHELTVTVEDINSQLMVTKVEDNGTDVTAADLSENVLSGLDFENQYKVQPTRAYLYVHKSLVGAENAAGQSFGFDLWSEQNGYFYPPYVTVGNGVSERTGRYELGFSNAGTYEFTLKEQIPREAVNNVYQGITYDTVEHEVIITVTDNGDGTLSTAIAIDGMPTNTANFTNIYTAAPVTNVVLNGNKTLNGAAGTDRLMKEGEFSFTLTGNGVHETVTNDANGNFSFSGLTFNTTGDYVFTITENDTHLGGVTYAQPVTVTVNVTDNGYGQLEATVNGAPVGQYVANFVNTYEAKNGHLKLEGFKELIGAEGTDRPLQPNEFSFTLKDKGDHNFIYVSDPATGATAVTNTLTVTNDSDGNIIFPTILYDAVGTHTYTVTEVKAADGTNGITYDKVEYTLTVEVTDNQSGMLVAKITKIEAKTGEEETHIKHVVDFFNGYRAEPTKVILAGNKVLENVTPGIAQSDKIIPLTGENLTKFLFSFQLEAVTPNAPMPNGTVDGMCIVQSIENGAITFPAITFDAVGEYKYTVKEVIPNNSVNGIVNGVTYTVQPHEITVKVSDDQNGQLTAKVFVGGDEKTLDANGKAADALSFKNTYKAEPPATPEYPNPGSVAFGGDKLLENITSGIAAADKNMPVGKDQFFFELRQNGTLLQTVGTQADGSFLFDAQVFNALGVYEYTIAEVVGTKDYITYAAPVAVKVTVTDADLDGWMEIAVTYDGAADLTVKNTYEAGSTQLKLTGTKDMDKRDPRDQEFSFTLKAVENAPMPSAAADGKITVKNDAQGKITFPEITYDTIGIYRYTMEEVAGTDGANGVTFDKSVYDVTVTVSDGGNGELIAVAKSVKRGETEASDVVFFNKYQAAPVEFFFSGTKTLEGRNLADGEFTFLLKNATGEVLQSVTNKDGKITFAAEKLLTVGTYKFTIVEDTSAEKAGITYDTTKYEFTVEVKDDGMGQLKAYIGQQETNKASVSFINTFTPEDIQTEIVVEKDLDNQSGKNMGLDGFKFQLTGEGETLTQITDADGFAKFTFTFGPEDAGKTFTYKLTEVDTQISGMTYSDAAYEYKFTVAKDAATGKLSVTVTRDGKAVEGNAKFVNVYVDTDEPPKTGDDAYPMAMALGMMVSVVALVVLLLIGKKERYDGRFLRS